MSTFCQQNLEKHDFCWKCTTERSTERKTKQEVRLKKFFLKCPRDSISHPCDEWPWPRQNVATCFCLDHSGEFRHNISRARSSPISGRRTRLSTSLDGRRSPCSDSRRPHRPDYGDSWPGSRNSIPASSTHRCWWHQRRHHFRLFVSRFGGARGRHKAICRRLRDGGTLWGSPVVPECDVTGTPLLMKWGSEFQATSLPSATLLRFKNAQ